MSIFIEKDEVLEVEFPVEDDSAASVGVTIQVKRLDLAEQNRLAKKHTKIHTTRAGRQEELDFDPYRREVLETGIVGWTGAKNTAEQDVPFSPEAIPTLRPAVQDKLFAVITDREEELLGKSVSRRAGSSRLRERRPVSIAPDASGSMTVASKK